MSGYRVFLLDENGHVWNARTFQAANDEDAIEHARQMASASDIEVWQLDRKVALVKGTPPPRTAPA